ncbi:MAG TPA: hypothetical protein VNN18_13290 [Candidatus Xenobia bacterium]|nr:hypothetical protein [Candidatus Xenobia bacterium]
MKRACAAALAVLALLLAATECRGQASNSDASTLTAEEIVARLQEANQQRDERLAGWQVVRRYTLSNELTKKESKMEVEVRYLAPSELTFTTRSQEGSAFLIKQVFSRMMEGEKDSVQPENKQRSAMTPENYEFRLVGQETLRGRPAHKLEVIPRREDTFLIRGHIWVDAEDYAVVRAEGRVVKRPSFWTRTVDIVRTFKKVGPFWLPDRTESVNEILFFGTTHVTLENGDYRVRLKPSQP